ncbi:MurR/RpiR family transcriptional regulator [Acetobacterium carbinolicum]|jgi:DNA-binding MurR/RpiR family transcriptional regulator|uniref:MurR/RpiR family transcriptional regulator n=1 Tax=Acetobacterium TaxID=33951 RepID=UPI000DBEC9E5|nr:MULTISPECIES: MurR/RpiR family transcriptional regulator [unclassified Acetobacterium]AWW27020.1 MurR/RpiR family transcriptional regulator [Acetobacterium sp. KB-1]MDK2943106.1 hypothetical protein [Acetobacterium sp.]MDZ5725634.1 MurR/RpiR family transcriptional regulator [Acetobacterium sp. K1/6]
MIELSQIDRQLLSKKDHLILDYLLKSSPNVYYESSEAIAKKISVSNATISRFWKKIGFKNIRHFQKTMLQQTGQTPASKVRTTLEKMKETDSNVQNVFLKNIESIEHTLFQLTDEAIEAAAELFLYHDRIYVFAPDASLGIAYILRYRLKRLNIEFILIDGGSAIYETINNFEPTDLVIVFSYGRVLAETDIIFSEKERINFDLILFTDLLSMHLHYQCQAFLYSHRGDPTEYHSMTAPMSVVDALILEIASHSEHSLEHLEKLSTLRANYQNLIKR